MTSDNSLLLILRHLDEIERKLDDMEELRTRPPRPSAADRSRKGALWVATRTVAPIAPR